MNHGRAKVLLPVLMIIVFLLISGCSPRYVVRERRITPPEEETKIETKIEKRETRQVQQGIASWYGKDFHGRQTSSGEVYDMYQLTCAHQTLPLGTMVMVTNLENGKSVELKVNDRGPFVKGRIIDVSYAAARMLDMAEKGTAPVKVEVFGPVVEQVQRYTIQVGSFIDETNAQRLADQLRKNFENVHVTIMETQTQKYHRVRVGQFENRESASTVAEKLSLMGFNVLVTSR